MLLRRGEMREAMEYSLVDRDGGCDSPRSASSAAWANQRRDVENLRIVREFTSAFQKKAMRSLRVSSSADTSSGNW